MSSNTKTGSASKIKMESFDDLFGGSSAQEIGAEQIINAPLADLHEFKDHPFKVLDDEKMEETTESIRLYGVLVPGIARPRAGGGYELIAGHRRKHGSERAGKTEMPIIVRNYSDDEATIIMVDSNIQREDILPSEKAKAYKMKYEAMKHQGKKSGKALKITLPAGFTQVSKYTGNPADVKVTFKSSNPKVATVSSSGKVTGKKKGTAKISISMQIKNGAKKTLTTKVIVK